MSRLAVAFLLAAVLAAPRAGAQETEIVVTALPFLGLPTVAEMGGASVGRLADDPRAALPNPAMLGLLGRDVTHATGGAPVETWFGESRYGVGATAYGVRGRRLAGAVALGAGTLQISPRDLADGTTYTPADRFQSLSAGVGTTGAVRASVGAGARYVTSSDVPVWTGSRYEVSRQRGATLDAGAMASADIAALAGHPEILGLRPALDVTAGYAQTHVSGGVRYAGLGTLALPRTGALGWSARAGVDGHAGRLPLRFAEAEVSRSADRVLARYEAGVPRYAAVLDGLPLASALAGEGDDRTVGRRGVKLTLAETVAVSWGRFDGWGYRDVQTVGWEVRTAAAMRLLGQAVPAAERFAAADLRLGQTTVWAGTDRAQPRTTLTLVVRR